MTTTTTKHKLSQLIEQADQRLAEFPEIAELKRILAREFADLANGRSTPKRAEVVVQLGQLVLTCADLGRRARGPGS